MRGRGLATSVMAGLALLAGAVPASAELRWRGIVEGPYGAPWDGAARERILRWMPAHGFNAYVHAPKDDLHGRTLWREPYPAAEQAQFDREIALARSLGVEWIPNLSPALPLIPTPAVPDRPPSRDLCFSCPADLDAVLAKLEPFRAAGARVFMISFDDVAGVSSHAEDLLAYGPGDEGFGRANGDFLNRLRARLRERTPDAELLTVGKDYSGTADTDYLRGLRATLRPEIGVMWTGTNVPSEDWPADAAREYGERIGRVPLVWDNWTNNDTAGNALPIGTARLFLGPYRRRAEAADAIGGLFLNPMNEADLNLLPLATAGDWMRDPVGYQQRASWLRAVRELAVGAPARSRRKRRSEWRARRRLVQTLRAWAETSYSTKLDLREAPTFARRARVMLRHYDGDGTWPPIQHALLREQRLVEAAPEELRRLPNRAFHDQAGPFLAAAANAAGGGRLGAELLAAERPAIEIRTLWRRGAKPLRAAKPRRARRVRGFAGSAHPPDPAAAERMRSDFDAATQRFETSTRFTYGWRGGIGFDIPPYETPRNLMDQWFDDVDARDEDWQPRSDQAAASVTLTLGDRPVALAPDGSFRLGRRACGRLLTATDGAGGLSAVRVPPCARFADRAGP